MTKFPTDEEGWREEAERMRKAIQSAPHLFALESLMEAMGPKMVALKQFSQPAHDHIAALAERRKRAMTEVA